MNLFGEQEKEEVWVDAASSVAPFEMGRLSIVHSREDSPQVSRIIARILMDMAKSLGVIVGNHDKYFSFYYDKKQRGMTLANELLNEEKLMVLYRKNVGFGAVERGEGAVIAMSTLSLPDLFFLAKKLDFDLYAFYQSGKFEKFKFSAVP